ncbi:MAG: hypothetical protein MZV70_11300 [Desulfobacterales bacterium]|nr:hypothetical protein [Desulfobacterales bacterium]
MAAKIVGKEKVLLQKKQIGVDIEETKSNGPSIQGFKSRAACEGPP